jgi:hypothetical protein
MFHHVAKSVAIVIVLAGCTRAAVMPLSADTVQVTVQAAPVCGQVGAQNVALRRAAIETINRGFDRFVILGGGYQNNVAVVGYTPIQAHTYGTATAMGYGNMAIAQGRTTTTFSGGYPIISGSHNQGLTVKMFRDADPAGANAIPARETLGPKWPELIKQGLTSTCAD